MKFYLPEIPDISGISFFSLMQINEFQILM